MKPLLFLALIAILITSENIRAAELGWQVEQPFRFLKFSSDHKLHEMAWTAANKVEGFKNSPVSTMEGLLSNAQWWTTAHADSDQGHTPRDLYVNSRQLEKSKLGREVGPIDVHLGWASFLRERKGDTIHRAVCWDADEQNYRGCRSQSGAIDGGRDNNNYVVPRKHIVRIKASGLNVERSCTYRIVSGPQGDGRQGFFGILDGKPIDSPNVVPSFSVEKCSQPVFAQLKWKQEYKVEAVFDDGSSLETVIKVVDKLVVSIGDSFASGEGNPDVPAVMAANASLTPYSDTTGHSDPSRGIPLRNNYGNGSDSYARWLDTRCHRSMYSPHTRAAIALALSGPRHHAITYLTFACSGAKITNGLFWPQDGVECAAQPKRNLNRQRFMEPQISAVVDALGATRNTKSYYTGARLAENDRLFKPGNHALIRPRGTPQQRGAANFREGFCRAWPGVQRLGRIPHLRRSSFVRDIDVLLLSVGGNDMGFADVVHKTVVNPSFGTESTFFSDLAYRLAEKALLVPTAELDKRWSRDLPGRLRLLSKGIKDKLEIKDNKKVIYTLYPSPFEDQQGRTCRESRLGMNVSSLTGIRGSGAGRPFGVDEARTFYERLNRELRDFAEAEGQNWTLVDSHLERFEKHGICGFNFSQNEQINLPYKRRPNGNWQRYEPSSEFRPYESRQRYFRTLNDAYMLTHYFKSDSRPASDFTSYLKRQAYIASRSTGGAFHVTAEGNARIADAIYCSTLPVLFEDNDGYETSYCR